MAVCTADCWERSAITHNRESNAEKETVSGPWSAIVALEHPSSDEREGSAVPGPP